MDCKGMSLGQTLVGAICEREQGTIREPCNQSHHSCLLHAVPRSNHHCLSLLISEGVSRLADVAQNRFSKSIHLVITLVVTAATLKNKKISRMRKYFDLR